MEQLLATVYVSPPFMIHRLYSTAGMVCPSRTPFTAFLRWNRRYHDRRLRRDLRMSNVRAPAYAPPYSKMVERYVRLRIPPAARGCRMILHAATPAMRRTGPLRHGGALISGAACGYHIRTMRGPARSRLLGELADHGEYGHVQRDDDGPHHHA